MRASTVTDTDVALLRALGRARSVVAASRSVGISRDQATYRIGRLARAFGGPVVQGARGGASHGGSRLTALGDRIVRRGFDSVELLNSRATPSASRSNVVRGVYSLRPTPGVRLAHGARLRVTFAAADGESVAVRLDPESILVARGRFPSSARNVLRATVETARIRAGGKDQALVVRAGPLRLRVAVTTEALQQLRLVPGTRVWLYVKATALRRVAPITRGSRPS